MPEDPAQLRKELERYKMVVSELQGKISALEDDLSTAATMAEVPSVVVTQPELREALSRLISKIAMILQAEKVLILLYQAEAGELTVLQPALGVDEEQINEVQITPDEGVSGRVFSNGESIIYNDAINDERTKKELVSLLRIRNGVCVPLNIQQRDEEERVVGTRTIGVLHVINKRFEQEFNRDDIRLAEMLGDQAAAVISNAQLYIELTEKKEELEGAFESISAGVIVTAASGEVRLMNPAACDMLGIEGEPPIHEDAKEAIGSPEVLALFEAALESGGEVSQEITGPGDGRVYQGQTTTMQDEEGEIQAAVGIFNDITEIRRVEQMKTTFVSTVSHELRTPLTSIKGFITTLTDDTDNMYDHETRMEFYEIINQECDRLTRLINDLLNVSRIEAGRGVELQLSEVNLHRIAKQVRDIQQAYTDKHEIINDIPPDFPIIIADADKVTRILENIVSNAIRYSPEGGQVIITSRDEGDTVVMDITDEGLGVPEAHRSKIFQRFHVVDDDESRETTEGTGIGLYLVQHLARAHGEKADVWLAHSEVGKGSTFSVRLPKEPQLDSVEE